MNYMIFILLFCFIGLLICSYIIFNKELAHPSVLFLLAYTISILCCAINVFRWNVMISLKTFLILLLGAIEFIAIGYGVQKYYKNNKNETNIYGESKTNCKFLLNTRISAAFVIIDIIILVLLIRNVLQIANSFGNYESFSQALTLFKENVSYNHNAQLNGIIRILIKFVVATGYVSLFSITYYLMSKKINFKQAIIDNVLSFICCILTVACYLVQSNRGSVLSFIFAGFVFCVIFWSRRFQWKKYIRIKTIAILGLVGITILVVFYYSASLVGRINTKGMFEYITFYIGGSIECFNKFVSNPTSNNGIFGQATFSSLIVNLENFGILNTNISALPSITPFIYYNDIMVGNIYTAYMKWMYDFGIIGIIVLQGIMAYVYHVLYYKIRYSIHREDITMFLIFIYGYIIYCIFYHPVDGYFYFELLCKAGFANVLVLIVTYLSSFEFKLVLEEKRFKVRWRKNKIV